MKAVDYHPFASHDARGLTITILQAALGMLAWKIFPSIPTAQFTALILGYFAISFLLLLGRKIERQQGMIICAFIATIVGIMVANRAARHFESDLPYVPFEVTSGITICVMILCTWPEIWKRWHAWREQHELAVQAARHASERAMLEARLTALQGQIEPHFLFNTLANVQYLLKRDVDKANTMLDHLAAYLRATLPEVRQIQTPLGQELTRVRSYLDIMQIRMGDRLRYRITCPGELEAIPVLPLSLATLVENALKHGLENKPGGGTVTVSAWREGEGAQAHVCVAVDDDGLGFCETGGGGVGLRNLRERLLALYGDAAGLTLEARETGGVRACLSFPINGIQQL